VTLLLAAAASLLLFGSYLVIRAVIESDADARELQPEPLQMSPSRETSDVAQHRRAA
jgi:hypothetical protein